MDKFIRWGIILIAGFLNSFRVYSMGNYGDWADLTGQFVFGSLLAFLFLWALEKGLNYKKNK